ncbi:DUF4214 domain-containing protein [Maritalea porphyrae]|uniref:DUF4214 domain-containing protein n=1 Tax=Maritalea porphyrae TaxID=880732 RepID=A0ABQ5US87_9HYPH|nr:DUF4214 domain-containing protein [Maritalea porphyrae]GLQ18058.1 hypothetical protein GCM10007879_23070 [Maritalea porphyrae]
MSTELLTQLYVGYYNRAPDPDGLEYWENRLEEGMTPAEIAQSFAVQAESKANYPYLDDQDSNDAGAFINKIYKNLFDRAPDPEGLAYWTAELDAGYPIGVFILAVINGARNTEDGQDKTMLANKVQVGIAFKDAEAGNDNPDVIADAMAVMSGVNHSEASIAMALGKISDKASGVTTRFTGDDLSDIVDGSTQYDGDKFTYSLPEEDPTSILVTNGADFEMSGIVGFGGAASELTVRGTGSSATFKAEHSDDEGSEFGRFSGDVSIVNVADSAELTFSKGVNFGKLRTKEGYGTAGSDTSAELNILGGAKVFVGEDARFSYGGADEGGDNAATSTSTILIQGKGSQLKIMDELKGGGSGGKVVIDIRSGGLLEVENDIRIGNVTEYNLDIGGTGVLEVRGSESEVNAGELKLGQGVGSNGTLFADDGATISVAAAKFAEDGGSASLLMTDGATLNTEYLEAAMNSGSVADLEVSRGAKIAVSDSLLLGQFNNGFMKDDGSISLSVPDGATKVDFTISDGGVVEVANNINVASRWKIDEEITPGNESSTVNITVAGEGSLLESKKDWSDFGLSKNAKATLSILDGGKAILGEGANFGKNSDRHDQFGGEGNLIIDGTGSKVEFIEDSNKSIDFGRGQGTVGNLTISNGGTLDAKQIEAGREGGTSTINVTGDTSIQLNEITAARFSGSTATINIADGAMVELENRLDLASFAFGEVYDDGNSDFGIANAATTAELNITNGGILKLGKQIDAATRWEDQDGIDVGKESATVNINVSGVGSKIDSADNTSFFGVSKDAVANVTVSDGGEIIFGDGATFGEASDDFSLKGGEGNLTVTGDGSKVSFAKDDYNEIKLAHGENTKAKLVVSDGANLTAGGIRAGRDGGVADIDIDGGTVTIAYTGDDNDHSSSLILGRDSTAGASTLDITNGGKLIIDGNGTYLPMLSAGRNAEDKGEVTVSGAGSIIQIIDDNPISDTQTDFRNGYIRIGREGEASLSILDGGKVENTKNGVSSFGAREGAEAAITIDGNGSAFDYGAVMFVGAYESQSDTNVVISNGATVQHSGSSYLAEDGNSYSGILLQGGGAKLTVDAASTVNSDLEILAGNFIVSDAVETVDINGALSHTGGEIDLQIASTASFDKLVTTGSSKLEGELNIAFQEGFGGAAGDSFELFNASEFEIGGGFTLDVTGMGAGLDAQLQVSGGVASLVLFDSQVADFAII